MSARQMTHTELMERGQALVHALAMRVFHGMPIRTDLDDLIAYGQVGLAEAARDYDPTQKTQFTTFAYYRVQGAIYDGISKMSWTSRARFNKLRAEREEQEAAQQAAKNNSAEPPPASSKTGRGQRVVSMDEVEQDRNAAFVDRGKSPSMVAAQVELSEKLRELLAQLPPVEKKLIEDIYFEGLTLQAAATRMGISKSWASRVHARTLNELGNALQRLGAQD